MLKPKLSLFFFVPSYCKFFFVCLSIFDYSFNILIAITCRSWECSYTIKHKYQPVVQDVFLIELSDKHEIESVHNIPGYINYIQSAFALQGKVFYHKPWAAISVDADWHSSDILKFIESNIHQQLIHYVVILPHGMSFSWHIYIIYLTPTIFNCVFSNNN